MILVDFASLSGPLRGHTNEDAVSITSGSTSDSDSASGASELWSRTSTQFYSSQVSTASSISLTSDDGSKPYECLSGTRITCPNGSRIESWVASQGSEQLTSTPVAPDAQRQHPRRTAPPSATSGSATSGCTQRSLPCSLTRQDERAEGFVALLVVFTAGLVEAIWPLSACPKRTDSRFYGGGVLPLRTFIQETLRRSKTSYSTLQVALYYLILLKQHLPKTDFTQEQTEGEECRAMQCGRRMFLAALILASKYLQDRNYSTRAWSKISGLRSVEINQNEIQYLNAINWKLHLPKEIFDKWSRIVLRLSALPPKDAEAVDLGWHANLANRIGWQHLITKLTPDLPEDFSQYELDGGLLTPPESPPFGPFESNGRDDDQASPDGRGSTVVQRLPSPGDLVSRPANTTAQMPPPLPRLNNLPTPQTTPCSRFATTPAVSALKSYPRCSALSTSISNGRRECLARANLDRCPPPQPLAQARPGVCPYKRTQTLRRVSPTRSVMSSTSSPESMVSDNTQSSIRSRSSSISSVASVEYLQGLRLESVSSLRCGLSREDGYDPRRISPLSRRSSNMNLHDELISTICTRQPGDMMDWTATSQEPQSVKSIAVFDTSSDNPPHLLNSISAQRKSLTEIEAAELLCNLERDLSRPTTALSKRDDDDSETTPRASDAKLNVVSTASTPSASSKSHKRSHSKTNEAMLANVRKNLLATTLTKTIHHAPGVKSVIILDTPPRSPILLDSNSPSPLVKASQSPTKHWAEIKMPVPIRGKDKRLCKTDDGFKDVAKQASDLLRLSVVPAGGGCWGSGGREDRLC